MEKYVEYKISFVLMHNFCLNIFRFYKYLESSRFSLIISRYTSVGLCKVS